MIRSLGIVARPAGHRFRFRIPRRHPYAWIRSDFPLRVGPIGLAGNGEGTGGEESGWYFLGCSRVVFSGMCKCVLDKNRPSIIYRVHTFPKDCLDHAPKLQSQSVMKDGMAIFGVKDHVFAPGHPVHYDYSNNFPTTANVFLWQYGFVDPSSKADLFWLKSDLAPMHVVFKARG